MTVPVAGDKLKTLAGHRTWLRLLHIDPKTGRSDILDDAFFLAPDGNQNPLAELTASLAALRRPHNDVDGTHPRCRFPARALWLEQQLGAFEEDIRCPRLEAWVNTADLDSISLMLVSGYFGNPASSFGHSLIRMNAHRAEDTLGLLDISVNFGAVVPDEEPTVAYILRGLFGGYVAGFSDRYYYAHDQVYTRGEYRDVWEYELALDVQQRKMLVYHLRELLGVKFQYFFLTKNCSYRQAQLLELVLDVDFVDDVTLWYAPIELFQRLHELDLRSDAQLIRKLRYWPSSQRSLHEQFSAQALPLRQWLNRQVLADMPALDELAVLPQEQQIQALDFLLEYMDYRLLPLGTDEPERQQWERRKSAVLKHRLRLSAGTQPRALSSEVRPTPAARALPSRIYAGAGRRQRGLRLTELGYTAFNHDALGRVDRASPELVLLDGHIARLGSAAWRLEGLDVFRLSRLTPALSRLRGEDQASWALRLGAQRETRRCDDCLEWFAEAAWGRSWFYGSKWTFSTMAMGYWGDQALEPALGATSRASFLGRQWRGELNFSGLWDFSRNARHTETKIVVSHPVGSQLELQGVYEQRGRETMLLRLQASF